MMKKKMVKAFRSSLECGLPKITLVHVKQSTKDMRHDLSLISSFIRGIDRTLQQAIHLTVHKVSGTVYGHSCAEIKEQQAGRHDHDHSIMIGQQINWTIIPDLILLLPFLLLLLWSVQIKLNSISNHRPEPEPLSFHFPFVHHHHHKSSSSTSPSILHLNRPASKLPSSPASPLKEDSLQQLRSSFVIQMESDCKFDCYRPGPGLICSGW